LRRYFFTTTTTTTTTSDGLLVCCAADEDASLTQDAGGTGTGITGGMQISSPRHELAEQRLRLCRLRVRAA